MSSVYILVCKNNDYYIGSTSNIGRRLQEHKLGKSKTTKSKLPVKLIYLKDFSSLKNARKFEYFLKRQRNRNFLNKVINGNFTWPRRLAA